MQTYITLLRGINVSGKNKIKMTDLVTLLEGLGCENVSTYIQSGNVLFYHEEVEPQELGMLIQTKLMEHYSFHVPTLVLTENELAQVIDNNPFIKRKVDESKLHVTFLSDEPKQENIDKASNTQDPPDEWVIKKKAVYVFCPNGYGRTKFNNNFLEKKLKVDATTRNWKTCNTLLEMASNR